MNHSYLSLILIIILAAAFYVGVIAVLVLNIQLPLTSNSGAQNKTPTVSILLYQGEITGNLYGFGYSPNTLTSPGPTLRFKITDVVNITVINVGKMPHAFAMVDSPHTGAKVLFGAQIGSINNPLQPGQQGTVIFSPTNAGSSYYYICPIPGHSETGMFGSCVITG